MSGSAVILAVLVAILGAAVAYVAVRLGRIERQLGDLTRTDELLAKTQHALVGTQRQLAVRQEHLEHERVSAPSPPALRVTRPTPYRASDELWYEIEVLVANLGGASAHGVTVTPFIAGRPAGDATGAKTVPAGRGVTFTPRIARDRVLTGPLSVCASNGSVEGWWRPPG